MLKDDIIIFDRYYCINSVQMKEIMVHYILQPRHIFLCIFMLLPGRVQLTIISMCFVWRKCGVLTGHAHANCHIHTFFLC